MNYEKPLVNALKRENLENCITYYAKITKIVKIDLN